MDLEKSKKRYWKYFGRCRKIIAVIYYAEKNNEKLTQNEIEKRVGLTPEDLENGIKFCINTNQVLFTETAKGRKYSLEGKTNKIFQEFYDKN